MATNLGQNSATSKARGSGKIRGSPRTRKRGERERREKERLERIQKHSDELNEQLKGVT
jgi:hypothetical protein